MGCAMHIYLYKVNNVECLYRLTFQPIRISLLGYFSLFWHIRMVTECLDSVAHCQGLSAFYCMLVVLPVDRVCLHSIACK